MKTSNLEVAQKLATITNRPLEDFYEQLSNENSTGISINERQELDQDNEDKTENVSDVSENTDSEELDADIRVNESDCSIENIQNIASTKNSERSRSTLDFSNLPSVEEIAKYYNGKVSERGFIIDNKIQMTKKEYNAITKNLSYEDLFKHPLMYVMFRAEGQVTPSYPEWASSFKE